MMRNNMECRRHVRRTERLLRGSRGEDPTVGQDDHAIEVGSRHAEVMDSGHDRPATSTQRLQQLQLMPPHRGD